LLDATTSKAFYSVRSGQESDKQEEVIEDTFTGLGPYGAILSAFRKDPNAAWLVTACDQPFITKTTLELLIQKRNSSKVATAFYNPETDFPEPLITIWEPRAYGRLLHFLIQGDYCPPKVVINSDIELVNLEDNSVLDNINTPEEWEVAMRKIDAK
jgi:molybdopterin-guanine dinucleotide biosynthesis protein A